MNCSNCGGENALGSPFCKHCGQTLTAQNTQDYTQDYSAYNQDPTHGDMSAVSMQTHAPEPEPAQAPPPAEAYSPYVASNETYATPTPAYTPPPAPTYAQPQQPQSPYSQPSPYGQPQTPTYGQQPTNPYAQPYQQQPYAPYTPYAVQQGGGKGKSVVALVLGILAFLSGCCMFVSAPLAIIAIIFGILSLKGQCDGKGMALAGSILAVVGLLIGVGYSVLVCTDPEFTEAFWEGFREGYEGNTALFFQNFSFSALLR
ncbi:MAG: hypothetical protein FWG45_01995 [Oscillospiraceae bacterium]|nr:hypothetical protein [Oscillospiraceae bacterium]